MRSQGPVAPTEGSGATLLTSIEESEEYVLLSKEVRQKLANYGKAGEDSIRHEMAQLHKKDVFGKIKRRSPNVQIIPSMMLMKEKFNPVGKLIKIKSRLVALGNREFQLDPESSSSPTAKISSVFAVMAIAAKEGRHVITLDITGAYLHAIMDKELYLRIEKYLVDVLITIDSSYSNFVEKDGSLVVQLKRALYGCKESGLLWFLCLSAFLIEEGFEANIYDVCVFNRYVCGIQVTVLVYVDDNTITSESRALARELKEKFKKRFSEITSEEGDEHSFLGMTFNFDREENLVKISMKKFIDDLFKDFVCQKSVSTPALANIFEIDQDSQLLSGPETKSFHSTVAKLLYLAKRTRPDILLPVSFLTTRVLRPTQQDKDKCLRVLKYIFCTKSLILCLGANNSTQVHVFADAAFANHESDRKSHTGISLTLGKGTILALSTKQRLVATSSTEAEVVAASKAGKELISFNNFLTEQTKKVQPGILHQDNQSCIKILLKGTAFTKLSRHIDIGYLWLAQEIKRKKVEVLWTASEDMVSDLLTKPLQGSAFIRLRNLLLGLD